MKFRTIWSLKGMPVKERCRRTIELWTIKLAWALPRKLAYWAAIRVISNATTGQYSNQIVPELYAMEALDRW